MWLEFGRLELECGDFRNAQLVLLSGLAYHPQSDLLLQKLLRVDEAHYELLPGAIRMKKPRL